MNPQPSAPDLILRVFCWGSLLIHRDSTDPQVWVHWPEGAAGGKYPMVAYNHGAGGGGIAILGYAELFEQIASYVRHLQY